MARYIDADAFEKYLNREEWETPDEKWWPEREIGMIMDAMPTADVVEVVHGEWEHLWDAEDGTYKGRCRTCGFVHFFIEGHDAQYNYCPNCGARMDGGR